jgi:predicted ATPase
VSGRGYRFIADIEVESRTAWLERRTVAPDRDDEQGGLGDEVISSNLPAATSEIVGREPHLTDVAAMVEANRLVTLVGAGGIGKTRLAIELAHRLSPAFDGGVRIAELAPLSDPALVPSAVGVALGLRDAPVSAAGIASALGSKRVLLVLDNCEHLIQAAASLAEALLHADARLHVIATSREPLRADGEWVYRVPPLEIPPEDASGLEEVAQYSAAKLFIERTRAADPLSRFEGSATAAALICRQLDGIPLAIELAAARAASLGVAELAARVSDRLSLLTDGRRTAPARHQTLRATLDWSYELLTETERTVMRRLAVFCGDFTLDAAARVVGGGDVADTEVVQNLVSLVAKSLVAADVRGPISRYRLLGSMRDYAMDKLTTSGEFEAITSRHSGLDPDAATRKAPRSRAGSRAQLLQA